MASGRLRVAVVGATGLVGRELLSLLKARRLPVGTLLPFSSGARRAWVRFNGRRIHAPGADYRTLKTADIVFMASSDQVSRRYSRALASAGIWVIDDSSAFRLDADVPLVIPEVNAATLSLRKRLIAGPNCTVTGPAVAGYPLMKAAGARAVRLASYQAVSGAGKEALAEFGRQLRTLRGAGGDWEALARASSSLIADALPRPIALNLFPQVGSFDAEGHSSEERKIAAELRKLWGLPKLQVSATAVRVPVLRGHSLAFWLETGSPLSPARARALLRRAPGVRLWAEGNYPTPREAHGSRPVHAGRVRAGTTPRELCLWVVSDNLLKGAALNSVEIAETLLKKGWLRSRLAIPKAEGPMPR